MRLEKEIHGKHLLFYELQCEMGLSIVGPKAHDK